MLVATLGSLIGCVIIYWVLKLCAWFIIPGFGNDIT